MKALLRHPVRLLALLILAASAALVSGCASTDDPDNASARPWNSPKTWESGLPSSVFEGR